jgi:hypothetical protein
VQGHDPFVLLQRTDGAIMPLNHFDIFPGAAGAAFFLYHAELSIDL